MEKNNISDISQDELLFVMSNKVRSIDCGNFGAVYPIDEFIECLKLGIFNGFDGYGFFASRNYMIDSDKAIDLSRFTESIPVGATHVVWWNS